MSRTSDFKLRHPFCCFCGGKAATEEIEHQPARIVFPEKHRPRGMEYPTCSRCNRQTALAEAVLAFICRFVGSFRENASKDLGRLKDVLKTVKQAYPGLLERMQAGRVTVWHKG